MTKNKSEKKSKKPGKKKSTSKGGNKHTIEYRGYDQRHHQRFQVFS